MKEINSDYQSLIGQKIYLLMKNIHEENDTGKVKEKMNTIYLLRSLHYEKIQEIQEIVNHLNDTDDYELKLVKIKNEEENVDDVESQEVIDEIEEILQSEQ